MPNQTSQNMGIGKLGNPVIGFVRAFRFTISSRHLHDLEDFAQKVRTNFENKTVEMDVFEVFDTPNKFTQKMYEWALDLKDESIKDDLTLTTYTGDGKKIYVMQFTNVKIVEHKLTEFDYSSSDISQQSFKLSYDDMILSFP